MTTVGLDINEGGKPAAIAVVRTERKNDERGKQRTHHNVWVLERLSARTHDEAVKRVAEIVDDAKRRDRSKYQPRLYGNVTATGMTALEMLSGNGVQARMIPVYLTPGDGQPVEENGEVRLHTGWLVSRLLKLLRADQLQLDPAGAKELEQELMDWRLGDDSLGSLMMAVGLAVQKDWCGILPIRNVGGPGTSTRTRDLRMARAMRESLGPTI